MRLKILLLVPFLLVACDLGSGAAPVSLFSPSKSSPSSTFLSAILTATPTFTPTDTVAIAITATQIPSDTQLPTNTITPTITLPQEPTFTPNLFPYVFPVQPAYLAGFSPGGHTYPATDIFAPIGTQYVAVTNGTIDEVSRLDLWDPNTNNSATAGGLSVRFIGDDGVRYYGAHLSAIAAGIQPGVWVYAGQLLGWVGNSGEARFTAAHVHFEITSPLPPFTKVDPFPYLTAWLSGQGFTPSLPSP